MGRARFGGGRTFGCCLLAASLGATGGTASCARGEPPAWDAAPGSLSASPLPSSSAPATPSAQAAPPATPAPEPTRTAQAAPEAGVEAAGDPSLLPQTHDRPQAAGAAFDGRVAALWDAIAKDDPTLAMPFFFPVGAYRQVKAVGNPEGDWQNRLVANYARDIHKLHQRLGAHPDQARMLGLDVPNERARWVEPGEEYNKLGYFRVYGTKLRYAIDDRPGSIDVSSLISWRGEWYVVHLTGFK